MDENDNVIRVNFGKKEVEEVEKPEAEPDKFTVFTDLIENGTVMLTLDARGKGVTLPSQFESEFRLNLNFCYSFGIPDFLFNAKGLSASLSFSGVDSWCDIPWEAVYMMRSHIENNVVLFPESLPPEMIAFLDDPDS